MANGSVNSTNDTGRRPWLRPLVILLIIFLGIGVIVKLRPKRIRVSVVKPLRQEISNSIATNGKVEPIHGFEAHAPLATTVEKVFVNEGAQVKVGALLMVLDDSRATADLANAQAQLKAAKARHAVLLAGGSQQQRLTRDSDLQKARTEIEAAQRQLAALQRLEGRGAASASEVAAAQDRLARAQADLDSLQATVRYSPPELESAQGEIDEARSAVEAAEDTLRKTRVVAPFAGSVYYIPVRVGSFVNVGDLLLQEANLDRLQVRLFVDEPEIGHLAQGQSVKIFWDALPDQTWHGAITTLPSTVVNRGSRVVGEVLCTFDNTQRLLLPNVNVNTTIIAGTSPSAITVPRESIHEDSGSNYVYVMKRMHLYRREVKLGISNLTRVEVLSGLTLDDEVAVRSFSPSPMADGILVKIVENPT